MSVIVPGLAEVAGSGAGNSSDQNVASRPFFWSMPNKGMLPMRTKKAAQNSQLTEMSPVGGLNPKSTKFQPRERKTAGQARSVVRRGPNAKPSHPYRPREIIVPKMPESSSPGTCSGH